MVHITKLPLDVKKAVFDYVCTKRDLRSCYRTCRDFYDIVIPRVYRRLTFVISNSSAARLSAALSGENRGVVHIRQVLLQDTLDKIDDATRTHNFATALALLGNRLPRNILLGLTIAGKVPLSVGDFKLLHERQRHLRSATINNTWWTEHSLLSTIKRLNCISSLDILIQDISKRQTFYHFWPAFGSLAHVRISIDARKCCTSTTGHAGALDVNNPYHREPACRRALAILFEQFTTSLTKLGRIQTLSLEGMFFPCAKDNHLSAIVFEDLKTLRISDCANVPELLDCILVQGTSKPFNLRELVIIDESDGYDDASLGANFATRFVAVCEKIESLIIYAPNNERLQPELADLGNVGKYLQILYLDGPSPKRFSSNWHNFFNGCPQLRQLATYLPRIEDGPDTDDESGNERSISGYPAHGYTDFIAELRWNLKRNVRLRTLHILEEPADDPERHRGLDFFEFNATRRVGYLACRG